MAVPDHDLIKAVEAARSASELVKGTKAAKAAFALLLAKPADLKKAGYSPLTAAQLKTLKLQGNTADDWKKVFAGAKFDAKRVSRCHFSGTVLLSASAGTVEVEGVSFPTGLSHTTLVDTVVGKDAFVRNVRLINRTVIGEGAVLFDLGTVTKGKSDSFGNGSEILIAIETGGREVPVFAELTVDDAWQLCRSRSNKALVDGYAAAVAAYVKTVSAPCNVISAKAKVLHTPLLKDIFLGESAVINAAQQVENVTVLSNSDEKTEISHGAIVKSSVLQWGSEVTSGALVDTSFLTEHSHVERGGFVTHSILGPNTGVAEGEVTSALLGPFVGFHHQSLLIAALWPEGKGNVGYGANVGSNHTAKAPDQEIWPGEGTFFGLGVNIKFPSDLTQSPYTIIASGVAMLPQKVEFPFSLINTPAGHSPGISPAYNEIMPAWVLSDNVYMVKRNEGKYAKRNKAKRSKFDFEVFRPETIDMMIDARKRLSAASGKEVYTAKEVAGLGKNYMSEYSRKKAVETYSFYIRYYAALGFKREAAKLAAEKKADKIKRLLQTPCDCLRWEHERKLLASEFSGKSEKEILQFLLEAQDKIAAQVQSSKEKDDNRGAEVIEDYTAAHKPAKDDSFVKETWTITAKMKEEINSLMNRVEQVAVG